MSKHLGNMLAPIPLMDAHGADALRWFMACSGSPWSPRRVGPGPLDEITRKLLMTYWNTASFFSLYAAQVRWEPENARPVRERPILDRWILGRLHALVGEVTERLETYDTAGAGRLLGEFVDDLSNWYVRRSRPRFWDGDQDALSTLYESLDVLTRLLAPIVPFVTEEVWQQVVRPGNPRPGFRASDDLAPGGCLADEYAVGRSGAHCPRLGRSRSCRSKGQQGQGPAALGPRLGRSAGWSGHAAGTPGRGG